MTDNYDSSDNVCCNNYRNITRNKYEQRKNVINGDEHDFVLTQSNDYRGHLIRNV